MSIKQCDIPHALQAADLIQEKNVDYQCLMPIAALSFHQQNLSIKRAKIYAQKDALLSI
ncbi:hypothetical protein [Rodentibacter myodis]|uniref:hypothetical protein n=1 Tax=Rodentibacter myodis TaxID=1907939 RepID=UPI00130186DE|nr:hypothetical protein [Rodentibacter myodis]